MDKKRTKKYLWESEPGETGHRAYNFKPLYLIFHEILLPLTILVIKILSPT